MNPTSELVTLPALIRGPSQQRICMVSAARNPDHESNELFKGPIKILGNTDDLKDGKYDLILGTQVFPLEKIAGVYQVIP